MLVQGGSHTQSCGLQFAITSLESRLCARVKGAGLLSQQMAACIHLGLGFGLALLAGWLNDRCVFIAAHWSFMVAKQINCTLSDK